MDKSNPTQIFAPRKRERDVLVDLNDSAKIEKLSSSLHSSRALENSFSMEDALKTCVPCVSVQAQSKRSTEGTNVDNRRPETKKSSEIRANGIREFSTPSISQVRGREQSELLCSVHDNNSIQNFGQFSNEKVGRQDLSSLIQSFEDSVIRAQNFQAPPKSDDFCIQSVKLTVILKALCEQDFQSSNEVKTTTKLSSNVPVYNDRNNHLVTAVLQAILPILEKAHQFHECTRGVTGHKDLATKLQAFSELLNSRNQLQADCAQLKSHLRKIAATGAESTSLAWLRSQEDCHKKQRASTTDVVNQQVEVLRAVDAMMAPAHARSPAFEAASRRLLAWPQGSEAKHDYSPAPAGIARLMSREEFAAAVVHLRDLRHEEMALERRRADTAAALFRRSGRLDHLVHLLHIRSSLGQPLGGGEGELMAAVAAPQASGCMLEAARAVARRMPAVLVDRLADAAAAAAERAFARTPAGLSSGVGSGAREREEGLEACRHLVFLHERLSHMAEASAAGARGPRAGPAEGGPARRARLFASICRLVSRLAQAAAAAAPPPPPTVAQRGLLVLHEACAVGGAGEGLVGLVEHVRHLQARFDCWMRSSPSGSGGGPVNGLEVRSARPGGGGGAERDGIGAMVEAGVGLVEVGEGRAGQSAAAHSGDDGGGGRGAVWKAVEAVVSGRYASTVLLLASRAGPPLPHGLCWLRSAVHAAAARARAEFPWSRRLVLVDLRVAAAAVFSGELALPRTGLGPLDGQVLVVGPPRGACEKADEAWWAQRVREEFVEPVVRYRPDLMVVVMDNFSSVGSLQAGELDGPILVGFACRAMAEVARAHCGGRLVVLRTGVGGEAPLELELRGLRNVIVAVARLRNDVSEKMLAS